MSPFFISSIVVVANVTGAGMIVPQVLRLHRLRVSEGVSAVWIGIGIALNLLWLLYGLDQGLWALVPVSSLSLVLYLAMAVLLVRIVGRTAVLRFVAGFVGAAVAPSSAVLLSGWTLGGIMLGLAYTVQFSPAAWSAIRSPSLAGISATTWLLAWIEASAWLGYGLVSADAAITLGGAGSGVMASVILIALVGDRLSDRPVLDVRPVG